MDMVRRRTIADTQRAGQILNLDLADIEVRFDLSGSAAGMYCYKASDRWFRFNPWVFATDLDLHISDTVPHEVAHYAIHQRFGPRRVKPHGPEWRALMVALGASPKATYTGDLSQVPVRRQREHAYACSCREHRLSTTRHNRIQARRATYCCHYCRGVLRPLGASGVE